MEKEEKVKKKLKMRQGLYYKSGRKCSICGGTDTDTANGITITYFCYDCDKVFLQEGYTV